MAPDSSLLEPTTIRCWRA